MLRLLIAFLFLALSSFSYATTYTYYQSSDQAMCDVAKDSVCLYNFNKTFPVTTFAPNSYTSVTLNNLGCSSVASSNGYPTKYNRVTVETVGTPPETFTRTYTSPGETGTTAIPRTLDCPSGYKIELIGCNAKCVLENQCANKVGQTFSKEVECGTATCPNGGVWRDNGSVMACDKGSALLLPTPNVTTSQDQCSGTLNNPHNATGFKTKPSFAGSSSARSYCTADYTYTGSPGSGTFDQTGLISMSFAGVTPTTENGQCPTGTVKGQFGSNGEWVCVPDTSTENNCPTGQIRDNQGNCVPTNEAGTCPDGKVKDASGNCVTPPPPQDTDGDGTPDDQDDTPNGDTGGSGSGSSGGSGSGSTGGSDSGGSSGTQNGSENGSGEKASASQAQGCGTPPACSGDPLQCASFIQDWKQNCQMMSVTQGDADKANALSAVSKAEFTTSQTQQNQKVTGFFGDFKNTANVSLNSGQCPNDLNLSVMGKQMTLKFSESCFFWRLLRALVIASAYLAAASIVFRSLA